jgi:hypothetical protein
VCVCRARWVFLREGVGHEGKRWPKRRCCCVSMGGGCGWQRESTQARFKARKGVPSRGATRQRGEGQRERPLRKLMGREL